jgi:DNA modification methylase
LKEQLYSFEMNVPKAGVIFKAMKQVNKILNVDALEGLKALPDESVQCCVTSPPYWGLRDYKIAGQLGMEKTPDEYVRNMVQVFLEVKRVLKKDGTLWLNIGDSYASGSRNRTVEQATRKSTLNGTTTSQELSLQQQNKVVSGLKPKDLVGIPWLLAFALRNAGYYLRSDIVWSKKNCMPESVTDRPTRSHEYIFLFSKSSKYFYDHEAIKEPAIYDVDGTGTAARKARQHEGNKLLPSEQVNGIRASGFKDARKMNGKHQDKQRGHSRRDAGFNDRWDHMTTKEQCTGMRNKRDVWSISPAQFPEAHFATFPEEIPAICIKAGSKEGDTILDPFMGGGHYSTCSKKTQQEFYWLRIKPRLYQDSREPLA